MGDKPLIDNMSERIYKAFSIAWGNNVDDLDLLAGRKGYNKIIGLFEFALNNAPRAQSENMVSEKYGNLRGRIHGANVYTPNGFNENVIELKDKEGQFTYTIDLSDTP